MNAHPMKRFAQLAVWAAVAIVTCPLGLSQQPATAADNSSQLPDSPIPANMPTSTPEPAFIRAPITSSSLPPAPSKPVFWTNNDPNAHVTVLENTLFRVLTRTPLRSGKTREGSPVSFLLSQDVVVDNVLIIPRGATLHGKVIESRKAAALNGTGARLILQLTSLDLGGRSYPLHTYQFRVQAASKPSPAVNIVGGAEVGALTGTIVSAKKGDTTAVDKLKNIGGGAAVGAGVGTLVSAMTPGPELKLPVESQMDFYLASPISVVPVSPEEAARLSQALPRGRPVFYVEGDTP